MWRPAHGATSRPGPSRPASGYGRALGRPRPRLDGPLGDEPIAAGPESSAFAALVSDLAAAGSTVDQEVEAPAPVTR
jgi:hypothetical protein